MKALLLILFLLALSACQESKEKYDKFMNTYSEVLLTRQLIQDSIVSNAKVKEILIKNGYTLASFKEEMMNLAKDRESFKNSLDSLRSRINNKIEFYNKELKKDSTKK